jgi:hypothetical protein
MPTLVPMAAMPMMTPAVMPLVVLLGLDPLNLRRRGPVREDRLGFRKHGGKHEERKQ